MSEQEEKKKDELSEKQAYADEILSNLDSTGITTEQAELLLVAEAAPEELKEQAESILAAADESGMNEEAAMKLVTDGAKCESPKKCAEKES